MNQSTLSEHVDKGKAYELCPNCFKPFTQYWNQILIEPFEDEDKLLITLERKCKCGYREEDQVEQLKSIACGDSCSICVSKCKGGCNE